MKQFHYKPKLNVNGVLVFNGEIIINLPKYSERLAILKSLNYKTNESGIVEATNDKIDSMIKMIGIASDHVDKVAVVRVEDGQEFNSIEDLEYDSDGAELINEIANVIISGVKVGKH